MRERLRRLVAAVAAWLHAQLEAPELALLVGLVLLGDGLWMISHPLAFIVDGAILIGWGLYAGLPTRPPFITRPPTKE